MNVKVFSWLALVALVVAVLRFFMKGWAASLGLPPMAGSFLTSVTIVFLVAMVIIFAKEGRAATGSYLRAIAWFVAFTIWCQALVIAGILITASSGTPTYYEEMMGKHLAMPPVTHALSHMVAAAIMAVVGSLLGGAVYWITKRGRGAVAAPAS